MPVKRPHHKSRNGCDTCRRRRVKCDEQFPRCGICLKRGEACSFTRRALKPTVSTTSPKNTVPPTTGSCVPAPETSQQGDTPTLHAFPLRTTHDLTELSLMHHWCTKAYRVTATEHSELLLRDIVDEGFRHGYVLNIVFALTSLHLASETQDVVHAGKHVQRALQYQNRSVMTMSETLEDVSEHNCNAIVMASILNLICTLISPLFTSAARGHTGLTATVMLSVTRYFDGIGFVMEQNMESIKQGPFAQIFAEPTTFSPGPLAGRSARDLQRLRKWMLARLTSDNPLLPMFIGALENLEYVLTKTNGRSVFEWIARAGIDFLQALMRGEEVAAAICMYWAVLMDRLEETWWTKYVGRKIVEDLSSGHNGSEGGWKELCQWCRSQVGLDDANHEGQEVPIVNS